MLRALRRRFSDRRADHDHGAGQEALGICMIVVTPSADAHRGGFSSSHARHWRSSQLTAHERPTFPRSVDGGGLSASSVIGASRSSVVTVTASSSRALSSLIEAGVRAIPTWRAPETGCLALVAPAVPEPGRDFRPEENDGPEDVHPEESDPDAARAPSMALSDEMRRDENGESELQPFQESGGGGSAPAIPSRSRTEQLGMRRSSSVKAVVSSTNDISPRNCGEPGAGRALDDEAFIPSVCATVSR